MGDGPLNEKPSPSHNEHGERRRPQLTPLLQEMLQEADVKFVAPTVEQAETAAAARHRYPLNLGDCFAYALAKHEDCPLLTLDRDFRKTDIAVILPPLDVKA